MSDRTPSLRSLLTLVLVAGMAQGSNRAGFSVLYPAIGAERGWSTAEVTGAFSLMMLVYSTASIGTGWLVDRFGVRGVMLLGSLLFAASTLSAAFVEDLPAFYLSWGLAMGVTSSGIGFVALLRALVHRPGQLGVGFGVMQLGQGLAALVAVPGLRLAIDALGWRGAQVVLAAGELLLLPIVLLCAPTGGARAGSGGGAHAEPVAGARAESAAPPARRPGRPFSPAVFWVIWLTLFCLGFIQLGMVHLVAHLVDVGFSFADAATLAGLAGAMITVGGVGFGWAADHWLMRTSIGGGLIFVAGMIGLAYASPAALLLVAIGVAGVGMGRGVVGLSVAVLQGRVVPRQRLGVITGLLEVGIGLGLFLGPWLGALARDLTGSFAPGLFAAAAFALVAVVGTYAAQRLAGQHQPPAPLRVAPAA